MDDDATLPIDEVARAFGLRVSALRYYDEIGLLAPSRRRGRVRHYGRTQLRRLTVILRLHRDGKVGLDDTATLLSTSDAPRWHEVLEASASALRTRIGELQAAHRTVEHLLRCPSHDPLRLCPVLRVEFDDEVDAAIA